ncbi:MAG: ATP-binding protein [Anaerolineae bacterium]
MTIYNYPSAGCEHPDFRQDKPMGWSKMKLLLEAARAISSELDLKAILHKAIDIGMEAIGGSEGAIFLLDDKGQMTDCLFSLRGKPILLKEDVSLMLEKGMEAWVKRHKEPALLADVLEDERWLKIPKKVSPRVRSALCVPAIYAGRLMAIMTITHPETGQFSETDLDVLLTIASQVAVAIENARLYSSVVEERHKAETILQSLADGVYVVDRQGHITLFNPAAEKITGRKAEEALGRHCSEIFSVEDEEGKNLCHPDTCPINVAMSQRRTWLFDQIRFLVTPDGRRIPVSVVTAPLFDEKGEIFGAVDAFWDISGRYEVERLKDEFISLVSHELRSPLTSIKAAAQLNLRRSTPYDENTQREMWQIIAEQCDHLIGFVETILSITRLEAGRVNIEVQPLLVEDLLEKAVTWQKKSLRGRAFFEIISPPSLRVLADEAKTLTILNNLLDNAVKFSPKGGRVFLEAQERADSVLISVQDEGPGIPSYALERIFDKFYQVNGTDSRMHGYGMGLYIVKMLAEAQGGQVWAENRGGAGSRLCFTLPKVPGEWEADKR